MFFHGIESLDLQYDKGKQKNFPALFWRRIYVRMRASLVNYSATGQFSISTSGSGISFLPIFVVEIIFKSINSFVHENTFFI